MGGCILSPLVTLCRFFKKNRFKATPFYLVILINELKRNELKCKEEFFYNVYRLPKADYRKALETLTLIVLVPHPSSFQSLVSARCLAAARSVTRRLAGTHRALASLNLFFFIIGGVDSASKQGSLAYVSGSMSAC